MDQKKQKRLIIAAISGITLIIGLSLFFALQNRGKVPIHIVVVPEDSIITIDNKPASSGKVYVTKGTHTLKASRQYFTDITEKINTNTLKPGQEIYLLPGADTPEAIKWLDEHPEVQQLREGVGGARAAARAQAYADTHPVVKKLPYRTLDYKIDYSPKGDDGISFTVTLYPVATVPGTAEYDQQLASFKTAALQYLKDQGVDTPKAEIAFVVSPE